MKISVIVPCYNCQESVEQSIESVLKQEETDWELILVDNNSTDSTFEIIKDYEKKYPGIIHVLTESKKGAPYARNKGLFVAKGDWIQFLDADDEILAGKFKRQLEIGHSNNADIVCGAFINVQIFKGTFKMIRKLYHSSLLLIGNKKGEFDNYTLKTVKLPTEGNIWKSLIGGNLGITSANLWKREKVLLVNGWNETLTSSQEYDLIFRLLTKGAIVAVENKQPAAIRYKLENSVSSGTSKQSVLRITDNYVDLRKRIINYLDKNGLLNSELKVYTENVLYRYLMRVKEFAPKEVSARVNAMEMNVPTSVKFKSNIMYIFRTLFKK